MSALRSSLLVAVLLVLGGWCVGCAGGATHRSESETTVQGEPPEEEPTERMPEGPSVKVDGDMPDEVDSGAADREADAGPAPSADGDRTYVAEDRVEALLERGPAYVFQVVTLEPVRRDGTFRGYRIVDAGTAAREIMEPQLQVGDVVTEVNGVPIEKPDDYLAAWKKLKHRAVLEVEFRREGDSERALWFVRERVDRPRRGDASRDGGR